MSKVCFSHINLLLLCYVFLPLEITFYQVNTFFPLPGNSFPSPRNLNYNLIPNKYLFSTSGELHVFFSWEMTCDLVTNRFLELSYEECFLFPHESTAPMIYILTFKNNLLPGKYLFLTSGKLVSTSWAISIITLYQINTLFHFRGTSCFLFLGNDM